MADYKEMYLSMVRASEKAVRILIEAQQQCEEMYLEAGDQGPAVFDFRGPQERNDG
jgi:hypothetical protein